MQGQTSPEQDEKTVVDALLRGDVDAPASASILSEAEAPSGTSPGLTRSQVRTTAASRTPLVPWLRDHAWALVSATLAVLLAIAVGVVVHLWNVSDQWAIRSSELTELNHALAADLAAEQVAVLTQAQQIELLEDQRATLQSRVLDLANAVSQSGDSAATAEQRISLLSDLLSTASSVTNGLNRCIDSKTQLATYMKTPEAYSPEELEAFAASVDQLCAAATNANIQFQQQLRP
ncbi:MAG: hypothetical protein CVT64_08605 [Actinobacteria bacterium HGW-Actinobacteria-4]|nr:MAG: hypothetical protein CVT64_08605 [Actinobacteria bacterium HGW-Actinobacteria-4]